MPARCSSTLSTPFGLKASRPCNRSPPGYRRVHGARNTQRERRRVPVRRVQPCANNRGVRGRPVPRHGGPRSACARHGPPIAGTAAPIVERSIKCLTFWFTGCSCCCRCSYVLPRFRSRKLRSETLSRTFCEHAVFVALAILKFVSPDAVGGYSVAAWHGRRKRNHPTQTCCFAVFFVCIRVVAALVLVEHHFTCTVGIIVGAALLCLNIIFFWASPPFICFKVCLAAALEVVCRWVRRFV